MLVGLHRGLAGRAKLALKTEKIAIRSPWQIAKNSFETIYETGSSLFIVIRREFLQDGPLSAVTPPPRELFEGLAANVTE
jgi:hypothetical protein